MLFAAKWLELGVSRNLDSGWWRFEKPGLRLPGARWFGTPSIPATRPTNAPPLIEEIAGLSPPTGRPTAPRQPRPNPKPAPRATAGAGRPLQPPSRRATSGEPPAAPRVPAVTAGRAVTARTRSEGWRPGRLHTWSWGRFRSCARANRKAAQAF